MGCLWARKQLASDVQKIVHIGVQHIVFGYNSYILEKILKNDRYDKAISQLSDEYKCDKAKIVK